MAEEDENENTNTNDGGADDGGGSKKKMLIIMILAFLVIVGGAVGAFFALSGGGEVPEETVYVLEEQEEATKCRPRQVEPISGLLGFDLRPDPKDCRRYRQRRPAHPPTRGGVTGFETQQHRVPRRRWTCPAVRLGQGSGTTPGKIRRRGTWCRRKRR